MRGCDVGHLAFGQMLIVGARLVTDPEPVSGKQLNSPQAPPGLLFCSMDSPVLIQHTNVE